MLSKDVFNMGMQMLITEYKDRGFVMNKDKSLQWYGHMKDLRNEEFMDMISNCLRECKSVPYMSDVYNRRRCINQNLKTFDFTNLRKE